MRIRPLLDRVIIKRVPQEQKTQGGIIIPDTAKEKPLEGVVVAVGKGKVLDSGTEVQLDGDDHVTLREDDIIGVIEEGSIHV